MDKIAEIRDALDNATPGEVHLFGNYLIALTNEYIEGSKDLARCHNDEYAIIFANAPEWLRYLLSELERVQNGYNITLNDNRDLLGQLERVTQERDEARNSCSVIESFWLQKQEENQRLQQERDEWKSRYERESETLVKAIENSKRFYAERDKAIDGLKRYAEKEMDGRIARTTLRELGVNE